jgi:TnpA family transposase
LLLVVDNWTGFLKLFSHLTSGDAPVGKDKLVLVAAFRHGTVSASLLMRKLAAYPRQNQVARALTEMGKLERTAFLLEYFRDESFRRRILIGLNKGEALHVLARLLFFGRLGELRDRALEDQMHRASCLHLLMAAIATWIRSI